MTLRLLAPLLLCALAFEAAAAVAPAVESVSPNEPPGPAYVPPARLAPLGASLLDERSQLITHPGAGAGGADESRLQNITLGMGTLGYTVNNGNNQRLADDFVIPAGGYTVTSFTVYAYQTGSTTTSTFNSMVVRIWNGAPNLPGSSVVFGDTTTNRMTSTAFTNIFRVQENTSGSTSRPIMAITASGLSIPLAAGTYWIEYGLTGTLASGPFAPAKSILGQTNTGNALQFNVTGWTSTLTDVGPIGLPLTIDGNPGTDLVTTLTDTPDPVAAGAQLTYAANVTNAGPNDATGVAVALPLAAGTTFVSASASTGGSCVTPAVGANGSVNCTWNGITVPAAARTVSVTVAVPANAAGGSTLSVTATATSLANELDPADNAATATTAVTSVADLSLALSDTPDPVTAGTQLSYVATVSNLGPSDAPNATISLPLPAGTTLVSATASNAGSCNAASPVVCNWTGPIAPGATRSATVLVNVSPAQLAALSATASVSLAPAGADPVPGNNSATATTAVAAAADLSLTLTDTPDPVIAGANLSYTAVVTNAGPSDATAVVVNLPTPAGTSFVSGSVSSGGSCAAGISCTLSGSLAPGASSTITLTLLVAPAVADGSSINATATASSGTSDPVTGNNSASTTTAVRTEADLAIALTSSSAQVLNNVPVSFSATSSNAGPSDAQNVSITLTLTPDFRYSSHSAAGASCSTPQVGNTGAIVCTWAGATAPAAARTLTVVAYSNNEGNTAVNASTASATADPVASNNAAALGVQVGYAVAEIPTLGGIATALLGLLLGLAGMLAIRRQA